MMKSMREASPQDGVFDNEQSKMFTSMLDQQLSSNLSAKGLGLADVLVRQLSKGSQTAVDNVGDMLEKLPSKAGDLVDSLIAPHFSNTQNKKSNAIQPSNSTEKPAKSSMTESISNSVSGFIKEMVQHAKAASRSTGMPSHLMLGQAALETGWGKKEIKAADGTPSFNLFGIKATGNWQGKVVEATTTEYINGVKQKRIEKFRAYDNYADSFKDFANMMKSNPRYQQVVANTHNVEHYAQAMQNAGYATDPAYAKKLASVIQKVIAS